MYCVTYASVYCIMYGVMHEELVKYCVICYVMVQVCDVKCDKCSVYLFGFE